MDENFVVHANALLRAFDHTNTFIWLLDRFEKHTADLGWIPVVGTWDPKPIIVSADGEILVQAKERAALRHSGCTLIHLARGWTNTPWDAYAVKLITYWPEVRRRVRELKRPAVIEVTTTGHVTRKPLP